jgi:hydrogenase nickel incorporation protein HypA/HybF
VHEYSLIQALVERVEAEVVARSALAVHRLSVRIGADAGVDIELFKTAFHTFRERTVCENADLDVVIVPVEWACQECGRRIEPGRALRCPDCFAPATLIGGDEIILERIELEVA